VILSSITLGCAEEAVTVAAMLGVSKDLWLHPRGRKSAKDKLDAAMADLAVGLGFCGTILHPDIRGVVVFGLTSLPSERKALNEHSL